MQISLADWIVIFVLSLGIRFYYHWRATEAIGKFFVTGHSVPWRPAKRFAGRSGTIGPLGQKQTRISGGNGRLLCR